MTKVELKKQLTQLGIVATGNFVKKSSIKTALAKIAKKTKTKKAKATISIEVNPPEARERDIQRNRVLLKIGDKQWHLTQDEARKLVRDLQKAFT